MLVLSRKRNEAIIIRDDIVVTVVDIRGDKVRIGVVAPSDVPVNRQEVYEAIQRESRKAATNAKDDGGGVEGVLGDGVQGNRSAANPAG